MEEIKLVKNDISKCKLVCLRPYRVSLRSLCTRCGHKLRITADLS